MTFNNPIKKQDSFLNEPWVHGASFGYLPTPAEVTLNSGVEFYLPLDRDVAGRFEQDMSADRGTYLPVGGCPSGRPSILFNGVDQHLFLNPVPHVSLIEAPHAVFHMFRTVTLPASIGSIYTCGESTYRLKTSTSGNLELQAGTTLILGAATVGNCYWALTGHDGTDLIGQAYGYSEITALQALPTPGSTASLGGLFGGTHPSNSEHMGMFFFPFWTPAINTLMMTWCEQYMGLT
jgi:hypothetical protein